MLELLALAKLALLHVRAARERAAPAVDDRHLGLGVGVEAPQRILKRHDEVVVESASAPALLADPGLLERVLANLVDNAVQWSPAGRAVRIEANGDDERVEIRVVDIVGLDKQADGGTHVRSTGEVGRIRVTKTESKGKGNKRIRLEIIDA